MERNGEGPSLSCRIGVSPRKMIKKTVKMADTCDYIPYDTTNHHSTHEISERSPEITFSTASPDVPCEQMQETPDYIRRGTQRNRIAPIELFSATGSNRSKMGDSPAVELESSPKMPPLSKDNTLQVSLKDGVIPEVGDSLININAGSVEEPAACGSMEYAKDNFYTGGDIITTDAIVGGGKGHQLYQSARLGNFSYVLKNLEAGDYLIDLHFAEIIVTDGPPGMRIFDVYVQEEKVISGLDIYAKVGGNQPLVVSDLRASVVKTGGLSIRFEGLVGRPIICGLSIRRNTAEVKEEILNLRKDECYSCRELRKGYDLLLKDQVERKRALDDLKRENELKSKECHEAWMSLQELQTELMRKSMHVGSLAFAVEGQVKEKSRWFLSLRELSEKFILLKLEHAKLSEEALEYKKCLADVTQMSTAIHGSMERYVNLDREYKEIKNKFIEESKERKDLYNKLVELKGNIRVFCRCRPLNVEEIEAGASMAIDFESAKDGELVVRGHVSSKKVFKFDSVFSPEDDQEKVFEKTTPFATSVLDGYNVCIFAYGQTGTGKTFTMEGTEAIRGVNYRTLEELFRIIDERRHLFHYEITVSVLEVYNEQIHDLLLSGSQPGVASRRLEVRQVAEGVHHVPGLVEAHVSNMNEVWEVLQTGSKARVVGSTNANEHSSRSHCMHCVMVRGENLLNGECTKSKLWLIDLAGSERVTKTDAQGERLKEAQSINRSLSALGDVISALATKSPHIPFRNSKLTHLLQDSLSGDSKTLMFVQISPNENDVGETLCSLNFASRVRGIELGHAKKQVDVSEMSRYKLMVGKVKQDNKNKDAQIKSMEETIQSLEMKNKAKEMINRSLQDKVKELESQLLIERKLARQHVDTKIAEDQLQQQTEREEQIISWNPTLERNHNHAVEQVTAFKDAGNLMQPLTENNSFRPMPFPPSDFNFLKHFPPPKDKENKPELAEEQILRKASRVSLCNTFHRIPTIPAPRRNSLIPLPTMKATGAPLPVLLNDITENSSPPFCSPIPTTDDKNGACRSEVRRSSKKINSILRRSLQKKVIIRSQLPQSARRGTALQGIDKMRISTGGSARKARRVAVSNAAATTTAHADRVMQKQQQRERGWNHRAAARNIF
ncbi:kinesin-like protein KIN-14R [Typha angustifolia]|uniref:kinesin-like protein KIN-14R n=1 Tax=Typha angustifolia TaxID=59011 RepID=UPI003C2C034D